MAYKVNFQFVSYYNGLNAGLMVEQRPVKSQLHEPCSSLCLDFLQAFMQVSELFASV